MAATKAQPFQLFPDHPGSSGCHHRLAQNDSLSLLIYLLANPCHWYVLNLSHRFPTRPTGLNCYNLADDKNHRWNATRGQRAYSCVCWKSCNSQDLEDSQGFGTGALPPSVNCEEAPNGCNFLFIMFRSSKHVLCTLFQLNYWILFNYCRTCHFN